MEKRFREWVTRCHSQLDKSIRFEAPADSRAQAAVRSRLGEGTTAFERISDGHRVVSRGDVVRMGAKPALVGRVVYFLVPQVGVSLGRGCATLLHCHFIAGWRWDCHPLGLASGLISGLPNS